MHLDCRMKTFYGDSRPSEIWPCSVKIDDQSIVVEYEGEGVVAYRGKAEGPGHYVLDCAVVDGRATLHRALGSPILEGFWSEGHSRGMWRIYLSES